MPLPKRSVLCIAALVTLLLLPLAACTDAATPTPTRSPFSPIPTPTYNVETGAATPTSDPYATPTPAYDVGLARGTLASARGRWRDNGSADYSYQAVYRCLCSYSNQSLKVTVRNDAVYSVVHVDTGTWLNRDAYFAYNGPFATIDDLLDKIGNLLRPSSPAFFLRVGYHHVLGYPTDLDFNVGHNTVDDGYAVSLTNYKPISPDAPPAPTPTPAHEAMAELAAARALWESKGSDDYTIDYTLFVGYPVAEAPLRLTVRNEILESVTSLDEFLGVGQSVPLDNKYIADVLSIDDLFDLVETALRGRQSELERDRREIKYDSREIIGYTRWGVRVVYDPDWGYPREFTLTDNRYGEATKWFGATLRNYEPLDPPSTAPTTPTPETSAFPYGQFERHASVMDLFSDGGAVTALSIGPAATVEDVLGKGLRLAGASPVHLALRGTAAADSARCGWRGVARTTTQREAAIRS